MGELEKLKISLQLQDMSRLVEAPFTPSYAPGAVQLSVGDVKEIVWEDSVASPSDVDILALDHLGKADWADIALVNGQTPVPPTVPPVPQQVLPDLTPSFNLPAASMDILSKHTVLPPMPVSQKASPANQCLAPALPPVSMPASTSTQALDPDSIMQTLSLDVAAPSNVGIFTSPSPYSGQLQLGPQEMGVDTLTVDYPLIPPSLGDTCCQPPPTGSLTPSTATPSPSSSYGISEPKKRRKLRDVHISAALMNDFLRFAIANTHRGIETCGILAGVLSPDDARFTVTTLIVPKQEGTTDTVQALAEEEIFEAQDSRGLYPLGWIHTHPTQTCFLSSIDIHTQCGYQTMMDEAIAIVMAPRDAKDKVGIFKLSTPGGLRLVQQCPLRGFHTHPPTETGQPVYEVSEHVFLNPRMQHEVIDLR